MKTVWIVQVTFTGRAKEMNDEAQEKFGKDQYLTNGFNEVIRTKATMQKRMKEWQCMGDVAVREMRCAEGLDEAFFMLLRAA